MTVTPRDTCNPTWSMHDPCVTPSDQCATWPLRAPYDPCMTPCDPCATSRDPCVTPRDEVFQPLSESMLGARIVSDIPRQSGGMSSSTAVLAALLQAMPLLSL